MRLQTILKLKGYTAFEMKQLNNGHRVIELEVNGRLGRFILDTGATHNVINKEDCSFFKVLMWGDVNTEGVASAQLSKRSFKNSVSFGRQRVDEVEFIVTDLRKVNRALAKSDDAEINGIIGMQLLRQINALVDCANGVLYVKR